MALLVDLAEEHGVPPALALRGTPLSRDGLDDVDAEVRLNDELQIIANMLAALPDVADNGAR